MKRKDRNKILLSKLKDLSSALVTDPDKLKAFADRWRGGFRQYSFYNLLLIAVQKRGATLCAGFKQWYKHKRWVNEGEKALWILAPGFVSAKKNDADDEDEDKVKTLKYFFSVPVFDISQTSGQELLIGNTEVQSNGDVSLDDVSSKFDYPLKVSNGIEDGSTNGEWIKISRRKNESQMVAAYLHELAHVLMDHAKKRSDLNPEVRELEAEATAYLVCSCLGIENDGAKSYIGHWNGSGEKIDKSALKILGTAEKILRKVKPQWFDRAVAMAC